MRRPPEPENGARAGIAGLPSGATGSARCRAGERRRVRTDLPTDAVWRPPRLRRKPADRGVAPLPGLVLPGLVSAVRAWSAHPKARFRCERKARISLITSPRRHREDRVGSGHMRTGSRLRIPLVVRHGLARVRARARPRKP